MYTHVYIYIYIYMGDTHSKVPNPHSQSYISKGI